MVSLALTIKEEVFGRTILVGEIPYLHYSDQKKQKTCFGLLILKQ